MSLEDNDKVKRKSTAIEGFPGCSYSAHKKEGISMKRIVVLIVFSLGADLDDGPSIGY